MSEAEITPNRVARLLAEAAKCTCPVCGECAYRLAMTASVRDGRCFSCRKGIHAGRPQT